MLPFAAIAASAAPAAAAPHLPALLSSSGVFILCCAAAALLLAGIPLLWSLARAANRMESMLQVGMRQRVEATGAAPHALLLLLALGEPGREAIGLVSAVFQHASHRPPASAAVLPGRLWRWSSQTRPLPCACLPWSSVTACLSWGHWVMTSAQGCAQPPTSSALQRRARSRACSLSARRWCRPWPGGRRGCEVRQQLWRRRSWCMGARTHTRALDCAEVVVMQQAAYGRAYTGLC